MFPHSRGLAATLTAALTLGLALVVPAAAAADPTGRGDAQRPSAPVSAALGNARAAVTGHAEHDTTLALTRLRLAYPSLSAGERAAADALLARPTDGAADPEQFGYTTAEATPLCGATFCVHYVTTTADAPAAVDVDLDGVPDWVETTLAELEAVVAFETGTLGYRHPATDGVRGGNAQFDVYLSQIGDDGLYGFCAPEEKVPGQRFVYSGYCVLDNDFTEFPLGPLPSLQVTAAHEFFHAIQFDYDATEDRWFMEATATWVEEQYADAIDDNRQYLPYGQLGRPRQPLDEFDSFGQSQYGNWLFIELLSQDFGPDVVRRIWNQADATRGAPDRYSTEAVRRVVSAGPGSRLRGLLRALRHGQPAPRALLHRGRGLPPRPGRPGLPTRRPPPDGLPHHAPGPPDQHRLPAGARGLPPRHLAAAGRGGRTRVPHGRDGDPPAPQAQRRRRAPPGPPLEEGRRRAHARLLPLRRDQRDRGAGQRVHPLQALLAGHVVLLPGHPARRPRRLRRHRHPLPVNLRGAPDIRP